MTIPRWQRPVGRSCGQSYGEGAGGGPGSTVVKRISILLLVLKIQQDVVTSVELVPFHNVTIKIATSTTSPEKRLLPALDPEWQTLHG